MEAQFEVEALIEHEYLVRTQAEGEVIESRFRVDPGVLEQLELEGADERQVVRQTAVFLATHQPIIDFPPMLDLADVIASYDDYPERLRRQLAAESG
ncbi:hypothetical protein QFZ79_000271 [Arthrobacter sp. V4I6]|uniref:hypothetical protein n=1 Tax=unclassified Arthrobacter TaxID=235627 RepID=UPI0027872340|nr:MULTISPECIES: hypothetical protein [unclassified Arthrobacter]MDQ0822533.1 hypothetical protein [Arthrobacter sp. V1I7]MDQ0852160.1 hypothetical protein [Arthrobacter sp. V4I6]